jgi:flagellar basal body-associated protein FliL
MAEEELENQEAEAEGQEEDGKKKVSVRDLLEKIKPFLESFNFKDPKNLALMVLSCVVMILLGMQLFSSGGGEAVKSETAQSSSSSSDKYLAQKAAMYVQLAAGPSSKETEFMATIGEEDRVLKFSLSLGLEKELLGEEIKTRMAPLLSETLRFLSRMNKSEIIEMLQTENHEKMNQLLQRLNEILQEDGVDLQGAGHIVRIDFTSYFFPNI